MVTFVLRFQKLNDYFASGMAVFANSLLLYLIFTTAKKEIRSLSRNLIQTCVLDLLFAIVTILAQPQVIISNHIYFLIVGNYFDNSDFVYGSIIITMFCALTALKLYAMPVIFYLRYLVFCRKLPVEVVYSKKVITAYLPVLIAFVITYAGMFWCYPPSAGHHLEFAEYLNNEFWLNEYHEIPLFVASRITAPGLIISYGFASICITISCVLVIFYCTQISRELSKLESIMSTKTKIINKQVHRTLIIQAIGPFTAGQLPVFVLFGMIFLRTENNFVSILCSGVLAWIPLVNPIAAILIIAPYRKRLISWLTAKTFARDSSVSVSATKINFSVHQKF